MTFSKETLRVTLLFLFPDLRKIKPAATQVQTENRGDTGRCESGRAGDWCCRKEGFNWKSKLFNFFYLVFKFRKWKCIPKIIRRTYEKLMLGFQMCKITIEYLWEVNNFNKTTANTMDNFRICVTQVLLWLIQYNNYKESIVICF